MPVGPLPSPGPFGRIVDVRVWPHGFTTQQGTAAGPAGSAIVRPNLEDSAWHAATTQRWGGNIVWTGSTPRHTVTFNGVRAFVAGEALRTGAIPTEYARQSWLAYNGQKITTPGYCFGAALKIYDSLPTEQTYAGTGNGTLEMQTPSTGAGALTGDYTVRCIDNVPPARFLVTGPDGQPVGVAQAGIFTAAPVLFDGVIRFTLQHGSIGFLIGDQWTVTVEEAEQLIAITEGLTYQPTATVVSRRGISPGATWRTLLIIPTSEWETLEQFPTPHFWSINASADRAVTTRWSRDGYLVHRSIDLDAMTHSAAIETPARMGVSVSITTDTTFINPTTGECTITGSTRTDSAAHPGLLSTTIGRFFVGDALAAITLESTHSRSKVAQTFLPSPGDGSDGIERLSDTESENYTVDLVVALLGFSLRLYSRTLTFYGEKNYPGGPYAYDWVFSETLREILSITPDWTHVVKKEVTTTENFQLGGGDGWTGPRIITTQWLIDDELLESSSRSTDFSGEVGGWAGGVAQQPCANLPINEIIDAPVLSRLSTNATNNSYHVSEIVIATNEEGAVAVAMSGAEQPPTLDTSQPAGRKAVFQTAAQDTRGNWLMLVSTPAMALHLRAGGPDSLAPSQVHALTDHPGADLWNIGAF